MVRAFLSNTKICFIEGSSEKVDRTFLKYKNVVLIIILYRLNLFTVFRHTFLFIKTMVFAVKLTKVAS
jgi:hypothetical protein